MKIALVYDYLTQFGGGERVLKALCEMFPEAPVWTLIYDEKRTGRAFKNREIHTSFLQKIPGAKKFFRGLIWLMPLAIEQLDLSGFDLVISVSHSFGKGIITKPATKHICYCLTPTRYLWHNPGLPFRPLSQFLLTYLRSWDFQAAQRPDYFIAVSENVKQRIKKYYGRESKVIYPPVETNNSNYSPYGLILEDYFLMVGRLVPYKRLDVAIEAFSKLPQEKLLIIGDGPELKNLKAKSQKLKADNIKFLGQVSDSELPKYYAECRALIFPQEEDFGIVPMEAMASGRPVIAYRAGGALETVKQGETGLFFDKQTPESLLSVLKIFNKKDFDSQKIHGHALKFDLTNFRKSFTMYIKEVVK
ncbi:MAG: glycosyltransferase [Parcubacteria group bacterium]|nr:glycosyltransferase [Parcubacteria group bacterium]